MWRIDFNMFAGALAALGMVLAQGGHANAQMSFDAGSFASEQPAEEAPPSGGWPAPPEGGFGGSFEAGDDATAPVDEPSQGGFGGSFDEPVDSDTAQDEPPAQAESSTQSQAEAAEPEDQTPPHEHEDEHENESADSHTHDDGTAAEDAAVDPQILAFELRDFGVPPTGWLRAGQFHAATPIAIPAGLVITTDELARSLMIDGARFALIDVLGGEYMLPNALSAPALASAGHYADRVQQQAVIWLNQITGGDPSYPIVVYCSDPMCWLSYNAALRVIAAGYTNVYWYRGGLRAWQMAGLPVFPSGL